MKITILGCGGSFGSPLAWNRHGNIDLNNIRLGDVETPIEFSSFLLKISKYRRGL